MQLSHLTQDDLGAVAGSPSLFVAFSAMADGKAYTSADGVQWTAHPTGAGPGVIFHGVAWVDSIKSFVAVGDGGLIVTSPDGVTWTKQGSLSKDNLLTITAGGPAIVAAGSAIIGWSGR